MRMMLVNLIRLGNKPGLFAADSVLARTRLFDLVVGLVVVLDRVFFLCRVLAVFDFALVLALTLALDAVFVFERD